MDEVGLETAGVAGGDGGVLLDFGEAQAVVTIESHEVVRVPATGFDPAAANIVAAAQGETVVGCVVEVDGADAGHQFRGEAFVGVDAKNPQDLDIFEGYVFLYTVAELGLKMDLGACLTSNLNGAVRAA